MKLEELLEKLRIFLALVIPLCYVIIGVYVMIEKILIVKISPLAAYAMGTVMIAYGIFRIYRAAKSSNKIKD